eukprot:Pgem_evm1s476
MRFRFKGKKKIFIFLPITFMLTWLICLSLNIPISVNRDVFVIKLYKNNHNSNVDNINNNNNNNNYNNNNNIYNKKGNCSITILILVEGFKNDQNYHQAVSSVKCYASRKQYDFRVIDFKDIYEQNELLSMPLRSPVSKPNYYFTTRECLEFTDIFFKKQCMVLNFLEQQQQQLQQQQLQQQQQKQQQQQQQPLPQPQPRPPQPQYLQNGNNYVLVLDADTAILNMTYNLEDFIYPGKDIHFYRRVHSTEIAAGNYLLKNTKWTRQFMKEWVDLRPELRSTHHSFSNNNHDNGALTFLFLQKFVKPQLSNPHYNTKKARLAYDLAYQEATKIDEWDSLQQVFSAIRKTNQAFRVTGCPHVTNEHIYIYPYLFTESFLKPERFQFAMDHFRFDPDSELKWNQYTFMLHGDKVGKLTNLQGNLINYEEDCFDDDEKKIVPRDYVKSKFSLQLHFQKIWDTHVNGYNTGWDAVRFCDEMQH